MSTGYGPQEATGDDVQAAHAASWDAVETSGLGSPESIEAFRPAAATHDNHVRHEAERIEAGYHEAQDLWPEHARMVTQADLDGLAEPEAGR